mmetsp:Transcript_29710/g.78867  ORF Transcript_29710/g.78867 Transcript_29710/m.78867 type:complete len:243 (+) Transcript_29710:2946-3674(+)
MLSTAAISCQASVHSDFSSLATRSGSSFARRACRFSSSHSSAQRAACSSLVALSVSKRVFSAEVASHFSVSASPADASCSCRALAWDSDPAHRISSSTTRRCSATWVSCIDAYSSAKRSCFRSARPEASLRASEALHSAASSALRDCIAQRSRTAARSSACSRFISSLDNRSLTTRNSATESTSEGCSLYVCRFASSLSRSKALLYASADFLAASSAARRCRNAGTSEETDAIDMGMAPSRT